MIWSEDYRVTALDVDMTGTFRASAMMRYMQETAYRHMAGTGPTEEELRARGQAFLLSRILLEVHGELRHGDAFTLKTFAEQSRGISFGRVFLIYSADGGLVAEARTVWVLYDFGERRIMRVDSIDTRYGSEPPLEEIALPRRLALPAEAELVPCCVRRVDYPDVDVNGHMNNTVYADFLCGNVPEIRAGEARVSSLYINYSNESKLDGELTVGRWGRRGEWFFRTHREDGKLNVEARITTV